ncbi:SulP family inorganic anion transporter [Phycicoccus sp.]|uniref:SulP family inorganic anion transporter n=1 Tax=Phycicoccus sp. TaxID=1902410 RepID=UPI002C4D9149|nr:SulP family inorganic anion transporter [Phycicoccus sp.]HMM93736.1 SulP family inorganic anion transporter [Phycicoccus sp.]
MTSRPPSGARPGLRAGLLRMGTRVGAVRPRARDLRAMLRSPRHDVVAGVTVGVVALPLALAFGIASGLGAAAGLVTAVVAGTVAALFGGSHVQVSGPTGAMTVVLAPIVAQHGADGVLVVGLMAGVLLVAMGLAGAGRYVRLIPLPVIEGFTLGIAALIALQQVPLALGQRATHEHVVVAAATAVRDWAGSPRPAPLALAVAVGAAMLLGARLRPSVPVALLAVVASAVAVRVTTLPVPTIGALPDRLFRLSLPAVSWSDLRVLAAPALAVAVLAALESLLSATVADAMSVSSRHDPDRELVGQGLANLASPLLGGIPATAAIARTAVNVRTGARSRLAAVVHSLVLLLVVLLLADAVSWIPLAALAGVLVGTAVRMVEVSALRALTRASRSDAFVLVLTFVATVVLDLATAVVLGIVTAGGLALRQLARTTTLHTEGVPDPEDDTDHGSEEAALLQQHVVAFRLEGPLFFGGAHAALLELTEISDVRVVILRMSHVTTLDTTGAAVLADTIRSLEARGVTVLLSGLPARFVTRLRTSGIHQHLEALHHLFATTPEAIEHARRHVARDASLRSAGPVTSVQDRA